MDTLAHAAIGGLLFSRLRRPVWKDWTFWTACSFGILPDIASFGAYTVNMIFSGEIPEMIRRTLSGGLMAAAPPVESLPAYIGWNYAFTHSLIVVLLAGLFIRLFWKRGFLPFLAWPMHILCDIPFHGGSYFQTPLLWPVSDWSFNGWSLNFGIVGCYWALLIALIIYRVLRSSDSTRPCTRAIQSEPRRDL